VFVIEIKMARYIKNISLIVLAITALARDAGASDSPLVWSEIRPHLERSDITLPSRFYTSTVISLLRFSFNDYRLSVVRASDIAGNRSDIQTIVLRSKGVAGINTNFFDEQGNPLGLVLSRGIIRQGVHQGGNTLNGVFLASPTGIAISNRKSIDFHTVTEGVQSGPRLLGKGHILRTALDGEYSRRAGICIDKNGRIVLFCTASGFFGLTLAELQKILISDGIDCVDALNFDGGGSAQMFAVSSQEGENDLEISGTDPVPVGLVLYHR
jgi:hypothetical protein